MSANFKLADILGVLYRKGALLPFLKEVMPMVWESIEVHKGRERESIKEEREREEEREGKMRRKRKERREQRKGKTDTYFFPFFLFICPPSFYFFLLLFYCRSQIAPLQTHPPWRTSVRPQNSSSPPSHPPGNT